MQAALSAVVSLRCCLGSKSRSSFLPAVPCPGAPFPPPGPSGRFPGFIGTTARSDSLLPFLGRFGPPLLPSTAPAEAAGPLRFLGSPMRWVPPSQTPVRPPAPRPHGPGSVAAQLCDASGPGSDHISGLNHAAPSLAVYASCAGSPRAHARLASGRLAKSSPCGNSPRGLHPRVSRRHRRLLSSRARLRLTQHNL